MYAVSYDPADFLAHKYYTDYSLVFGYIQLNSNATDCLYYPIQLSIIPQNNANN